MRRTRRLLVAMSVAIVLAVPILGLSLSVPKAAVPAHALRFGEGVTIDFLAPLSNRTDFYGGSVIPVRIALLDNDDSGVRNANVTVWVDGAPGTSPGSVNMGNQMKNLHGGLYMFNLNTKPYPAGPGSAPITITVKAFAPEDHPVESFVVITLD